MVQFAKYGPKTKDQCLRLFDELNKYRTLPKISKEDFELIFDELDDSHDFKINAEEFDDLCHAIALKFSKEDCPSCFEYIPSVYYSAFSEKLKTFIRSDTFANIIAFILVINLIAVIIETTLDIADSSSQQVWQVVEFVFGWIYVLEMGLKIYAYGFVNYWRDGQNKFDFIITCVIENRCLKMEDTPVYMMPAQPGGLITLLGSEPKAVAPIPPTPVLTTDDVGQPALPPVQQNTSSPTSSPSAGQHAVARFLTYYRS